MVSRNLNSESTIEVKIDREVPIIVYVKKYLVAALKKTKKFCETNLRKHTVSSLQMRWFPQILDIYVFGRFGNDEVWMLKTEYR